jgi:Cupin-like domain
MSITETYEEHPTTRPGISTNVLEDSSDLHDSEDESFRHPLLVKPSGNALTEDEDLRDAMGRFAQLPDPLVLVLLEFLEQESLISLGSTCRGLFAYAAHDQLWRDMVVRDECAKFDWRGSWRASMRRLSTSNLPKVDCSNLFSDALHRPFVCSQLELGPYASKIPKSNTITRLEHLSRADFSEKWTDRPFILTEPVKTWRIYQAWSQTDLAKVYADTVFRAEAVDWPLKTYLSYLSHTTDESPLYLFDRAFVEKMRLIIGPDGDYQPPECFQEDLFTVLGDQRPDHRWLIIGPEKSGSTFHKDPNATSAWNAVIRGSKYWIMFPASVVPPGVFMSEDQSEVTSPLSIAEWLLSFHAEARQIPGCLEGICHEGEVLHVPSGWWHLVVNLEPAIAITQNFVPRSHLASVADFLKRRAGQVSGFKDGVEDPFQLFMTRLKEGYPDVALDLENSSNRKRKWEEVIADASDDALDRGGFSFGFGDDVGDED